MLTFYGFYPSPQSTQRENIYLFPLIKIFIVHKDEFFKINLSILLVILSLVNYSFAKKMVYVYQDFKKILISSDKKNLYVYIYN